MMQHLVFSPVFNYDATPVSVHEIRVLSLLLFGMGASFFLFLGGREGRSLLAAGAIQYNETFALGGRRRSGKEKKHFEASFFKWPFDILIEVSGCCCC